MATAPRLDFPGAFHHVMARGIDRTDIFRDDDDREDFLARLACASAQTAAHIHAWALQPNHVHLLVESGPPGLSLLMRKLLGGYARAFNHRRARVGYLFQGRFRSVLVDAETYFLELVRYIHLNPLRGRVVATLEELARFPWTGHATLLGVHPRGWQTTSAVLGRFGNDVESATRAYLEFVAAGRGLGHQPQLELGRLVRRTHAGLRIVEKTQRGRERWGSDERVLGSDVFLDRIGRRLGLGALQSAPESATIQHRLDELLQRVARQAGVEVAEVCNRSQRRVVVSARSAFCCRACRHLGVAVNEVARHLGITPRAARYLAGRGGDPRKVEHRPDSTQS